MAVTAADIGLIGLAVMGENLVLNMESHDYTVAVYNRTVARVDEFLAGRAKGKRILGCHAVNAVGLLQGTLFAERKKCADPSVFFLYTRVVRFGERERSRLTLLNGGADGVDGELGRFHKESGQ